MSGSQSSQVLLRGSFRNLHLNNPLCLSPFFQSDFRLCLPETEFYLGIADLTGRFVVTLSPQFDEYGEFMLAAVVPGPVPRWVVWTSGDAPPHDFEFRLLDLKPGNLRSGGFRLIDGVGANRRLPEGMDFDYNQI